MECHCQASGTKEFTREAMPRRRPGVHQVKETCRLVTKESQDSRSNMGYETGRATLIIHDAELVSLRCQSKHRVSKIPAAHWALVTNRIEAAGSHNQMPGRCSCGLFTSEFAGPILVDWARLIRLHVWHRAGRISAKHIIGADLNERGIPLTAGSSKLTNCISVHQPTCLWIAFRRIDSRPSSAIDDHRRVQFFHDAAYHGGLREVEL